MRKCYVRNLATKRDERDWLLISVTTGSAASLRVHVWRTLRRLGAVYLQQSVCLLPDRTAVARQVARLVARVRDQGGQARVLRTRLTDSGEARAMVEQQRADRDVEYAEVVERVPAFLAEIETETARGRATYAEVEESEADLERFDRWMAKIAARDYFDASGGVDARAAAERCREALAAFEAEALHSEALGPEALDPATPRIEAPQARKPPAPERRLRAVEPRDGGRT